MENLTQQRPVRRRDRELSPEAAQEILSQGQYGILSVHAQDGPYGVPLSYLYQDGAIYFHCARQGLKLDCLRLDPRACFTVVSKSEPVFTGDNFTVDYASAVAFGVASEIDAPLEKGEILMALCRKYLPGHDGAAAEVTQKSLAATSVWRVDVGRLTGKART